MVKKLKINDEKIEQNRELFVYFLNRYALGSAKVNEQSFSNVEEIVMFYTREELVLHSGGVEMGSTKLTDTPPK